MSYPRPLQVAVALIRRNKTNLAGAFPFKTSMWLEVNEKMKFILHCSTGKKKKVHSFGM